MGVHKCHQCKKTKPLNDKEFKPKGNGFQKVCRACSEKYYHATKKSNKENERVQDLGAPSTAFPDSDPDDAILMGLPVLDLDAFLGVIAQPIEDIKTLEARVKIPRQMVEGVHDLKKSADWLVGKINNRMKFHFTSHSRYDHKNADSTRVMYHCAQSKTRQHDSRKNDDQSKQRDKESMTAFECNGWIHITLFHYDPVALVKIRDETEHVSYWSIEVPLDIKKYVLDNIGLSAPELWNNILKKHPSPKFAYGNTDGSISDGDDHIWLGDKSVLSGKGSREGLTLTRASAPTGSDEDISPLGKRKVSNETMSDQEPKRARVEVTPDKPMIDLTMLESPPSSSSPITYGSEDEDELDELRQTIRRRGEAFRRASEIYLAQADHPNLTDGRIWMKSQIDRGVGKDVELMVEDVSRYESRARKNDTTWAIGKGKEEKRRMKNTMGYQL